MTRTDSFDPYSPVNSQDASDRRMENESKRQGGGSRGKRGCGGCLGFILMGSAAFFLVAMVLIAKMGILEIPVLTERLYKSPVPIRQVSPLLGYGTSDIMASLSARTSYSPASSTIRTFIIEEEFTTLLGNALKEADDLPIDIVRVQVVVTEERMEFFIVGATESRDIGVKVDIIPNVKKGKLDLDIENVEIGSLKVPELLIGSLLGIVDDTIVKSINDTLSGIGRLDRIRLEKGTFTVHLRPIE